MRAAVDFPFRAVGGNVLLRKVTADTMKMMRAGELGLLKLTEARDGRVLQIAEIVGLGSRWTQVSVWNPPMPIITKSRHAKMMNEKNVFEDVVDPNWTPPDLSMKPPRPPGPVFTAVHRAYLDDIQVGDLVVYNVARVYDTFSWHGNDLIVYPGCWLHAVADSGFLAEHPEARQAEAHEQ